MVKGLIGKKLGMSQYFDDKGRMIPVTMIQVGPCVVLQHKTKEVDGYEALQLGYLSGRKKKMNRPSTGHAQRHAEEQAPFDLIREFTWGGDAESMPKGGSKLGSEVFAKGAHIDVVGISRGHGFQGVMKRHNFHGGKSSHGSMFHRAPGSVGMSATPARVLKGKKMPGQLGATRVTVKNLEIIEIMSEQHVLMVKGAVPGNKGSLVLVHRNARELANAS